MALTSFCKNDTARVPLVVIGVFLVIIATITSINLLRQYPGSTPARTTDAAQPTGTSSEPQQAPFLTAAGALAVMLGIWMWKREKKA